jgi:hypothetical protein
VLTNDALHLRNWAVRSEDAVLPLQEITRKSRYSSTRSPRVSPDSAHDGPKGFSRLAIDPLQRDSCVTATGGRYTMEFKTKATLAEWANDQTMAEIAAQYNGLPGVKPVKKFESREVAVTRIWAALGKMARKPKAAPKKVTLGRKQPKTSKHRKASTVRDEVVKLLSRTGGATLADLMKTFKWQAHSVRGFISVLASKHGFKIVSSKVDGVRSYRIK